MPSPSADTPAHTPIALPRSTGFVKTFVRIESVDGMISAAPAPMSARNAMSSETDDENAAAADAVPNTASPAVSAPRRPKRSPRLPAVSSSPAKTSTYESTSHWRSDVEKCKPR